MPNKTFIIYPPEFTPIATLAIKFRCLILMFKVNEIIVSPGVEQEVLARTGTCLAVLGEGD